MPPHVALHDVHKSFGAHHAVRGVSLDISRNEFVTLLGPSGCGKTTLLRLIGGLEAPDRGTIAVGGRSVQETPTRQRRTRMVFQQYVLFPHMTVAQNVEFGLRMRGMPQGERRQRVLEALDLVKLGGKLDARPDQLSGGQQQRVALARAVVTEPDVLLLDEPLAALDLQLRRAMQIELKTIQQQLGITFIYVTHDQTEALAMSDRIVVMSEGRIEQVGTGPDIYDRPMSRFVGAFVGEANIIEGRIAAVDGERVEMQIGSQIVALPQRRPPLSAGERATFLVRPEKLVFQPPAEGAAGLRYRLVQKVFLGSAMRLVLALDDGTRLLADAGAEAAATVGSDGVVSWRSADVHWLVAHATR